ncbi:MAG: hypothetical protein AB8F95_08235, partial [Bacteroidia bacterium]
ILIICLFPLFLTAQKVRQTKQVNPYALYVKGGGFEGVIFDGSQEESWSHYATYGDSLFTPTLEEVEIGEKVLRKQLQEANQRLDCQKKRQGPAIHKKLKKYGRQYYGSISEKGERLLHINCFWKADGRYEERWLKGLILIKDGCSYYWRVTINLKTQKITSLWVNGKA